MTLEQAKITYPGLMAYILDRNALKTTSAWCDQLHRDEANAVTGAFADVAAELDKAQADYKAGQEAIGREGYPYNTAMGEFLGLPLKANHEPKHGYYMASGVRNHYKLGEAQREAAALIAEGKPLLITTARSKTDRKPCRFAKFTGPDQIQIDGGSVVLQNGKKRGKLSSNWSTETAIVKLVAALKSGQPYA